MTLAIAKTLYECMARKINREIVKIIIAALIKKAKSLRGAVLYTFIIFFVIRKKINRKKTEMHMAVYIPLCKVAK